MSRRATTHRFTVVCLTIHRGTKLPSSLMLTSAPAITIANQDDNEKIYQKQKTIETKNIDSSNIILSIIENIF